ncbi:hypothetical protein [Aliarcobacter butzleri]|uniref:hypothetical protein n=1 Tax=Aliarcobacter butzleri TaxID=28197 RepID=UPI0021B302B3|nr:hypothetical protein [Aliarcobacter butzleri]MCT7647620.1 hypothetical protein [Aliarcobacter butzleri]
MENKYEIIENILKDENNHSLISIREKILLIKQQLISKELSFGLKALLNDFFNCNYIKENERKIDINKIDFFIQDGFFEDLFSEIYSKKSEIEYFDIFNLSEKSNYIYTDYEPLNDWDNVYGTLKNDILYGFKQIDNCSENIINSRYKSSINIFNFGPFVFNSVSTGYSNLSFMTGVSWFANELKDYKVKLNYSFEYNIDIKYLEMLYEILKVLTDVSEELAQVSIHTRRNGSIRIIFKNELQFIYEIEAKNIEELYLVLKETNQNIFINFLSQNGLLLRYEDNKLNCSKMANKKIFSIDFIYIKNFDPIEMNYIMCNINQNLNIIDLTYYSLHLLLPVKKDIEKEFVNSPIENKLKLFISIFSIKKNIDYTMYALDDNEIAKIYGTTKNNIVETYKKKKVEQYEILRLGTTCKAYKIKEEDILEIIKNYKLEKIEL